MINRDYVYPAALGILSIAMFLLFYAGISEEGYGSLLSMSGFPLEEGTVFAIAALSALLSPPLMYLSLRRFRLGEWESFFGGVMLLAVPALAANAGMVVDLPLLLAVLFFTLGLFAASFSFIAAAFPFIVATYFAPLSAAGVIGIAAWGYLGKRKAGALVVLVGIVGALFSQAPIGPNLYLGEYSLLVPFALALLVEGFRGKRWDESALGTAAILCMPFSPAAAAPLLAMAGAMGLAELGREKDRPLLLEFLVVLCVAVFYSETDPVKTGIVGLFAFVALYMLASLYKVKMRALVYPAAMLLAAVALFTCVGNLSAQMYQGESLAVPSAETIELFKWAGENGGASVLAYPSAYRFYTGMDADVVDPLGPMPSGKLAISYDSLDAQLSQGANVFWHAGTTVDGRGAEVQVFINRAYALAAYADEGGIRNIDGELIDAGSGRRYKAVPFTKLELLDGGLIYSSEKNRLVNIDGIGGSALASSLKAAKIYSVEGGFVVGR